MKTDWATVKIMRKHYERLERLRKECGVPVQYHINEAMDNYMNDQFPVTERRARIVTGTDTVSEKK